MSEYRLEIGDIVIGLELPDSHRNVMEEYFQRRSSPLSPHLYLKIDLTIDGMPRRIPESLFISKQENSGFFTIGEGFIRVEFDPERRRGRVWVADYLLKGRLLRIFEQLLYQAFYSARKLEGCDAYLVHSAGIVHEGSGFLFVGQSGAGKSTVALLSPAGSVLNDEISLIEFRENSVSLRDTPFNGFFRQKARGRAPMKSVFILEQGPKHEIMDLTPAESTKALFRQLVPPAGLEDSLTDSTIGQMMDLAKRVVETLPVKLLRFRPDAGFWGEIERAFIRR